MIDKFTVISESNQSTFVRKVEDVVENMQRENLEVEIQFSTTENDKAFTYSEKIMYSAMIIGRTYEE